MNLKTTSPPKDFADVRENWPLADESRFLNCGSIKWHVQQIGEPGSDATVLLVHGTGGTTHSMAPLAAYLSKKYHVTLIDLPGHGFTRGETNRHYTLPGMARALSLLIDSLKITPVIGVGHSAGAAILLQMALEDEKRFRGIVGINAALEPIEGNAIFSPLAKALFVNPFVPSAVAWQARYFSPAKSLLKNTGSPLDKINVAAYDRLLQKSSHIAGALGMMANWDLKPLRARLPELQLPVELIATDDDAMVPARVSGAAASEANAVSLFTVPKGGHLIHEFEPETIANRIDAMAASPEELPA
ncbi:MAG: alpha/beta fold hydrolase BchO [Pseudomonadota bacterium]